MNCSKKIIFFDIDGTLYMYNKGIPDDTKNALKLLRDNGHVAVLCTGRTKAMIFDNILSMGFDGIIAGAGTYLEYQGKELYRYELDSKIAREIVNDMKKYGILPIPEGIEHMYCSMDEKEEKYINVMKIYQKEMGDRIIKLEEDNELKISKVSGKLVENSQTQEMGNKWGDKFKLVYHDGKMLEMIPKDYSKAFGIKKLLEYIGADRKNTYAFGDSMNDYEMLTYVEHGVAMGNSTKALKEKFTNITDDFDKGGVWNSLKKYGLI